MKKLDNIRNIKKIGKHKYIVTEDFTYYSPRYKKYITAHKGFVFDGYSEVWDTPDLRPSKIHDIAYQKRKWDDGTDMTKTQADFLLYDLMKESHCWFTRRLAPIYFAGVMTFGWIPWWRGPKKDFRSDNTT